MTLPPTMPARGVILEVMSYEWETIDGNPRDRFVALGIIPADHAHSEWWFVPERDTFRIKVWHPTLPIVHPGTDYQIRRLSDAPCPSCKLPHEDCGLTFDGLPTANTQDINENASADSYGIVEPGVRHDTPGGL